TTSIARALAIYVSTFGLSLFLVATAFVDLEHMVILPDPVNAVFAIVGVATATLRGFELIDGFIGAGVGLAVGFFINSVYRMLRGRRGFATGDTVRLRVCGSWFGWRGVLFGLFAGALQGTLILIVMRLLGGTIKEPDE